MPFLLVTPQQQAWVISLGSDELSKGISIRIECTGVVLTNVELQGRISSSHRQGQREFTFKFCFIYFDKAFSYFASL